MSSYDSEPSVGHPPRPDSTATAARKALQARKDHFFRERQLEMMAKFRHYRHGRNYKKRLSLSRWPRYEDKEDVDHEFLVTDDITKEPYRGQRSAPNHRRSLRGLPDREKRRYARARINTVSRKLFAFGIRFRRIISCGGMGMAALFEVQNRATGLFNKIVAKIALTEKSNTNLHQEREFLETLKFSDHILRIKQIRELQNMSGGYRSKPVNGTWPADPSTLDEPTVHEVQEADADTGIMLTEYLPFGSLDHWIAKAAELQEDFSNEACWRMLLCLAKACMSMKYPPGLRYTEHEAVNIVHFDLDPTNVLVDGAPMRAHASRASSEQQARSSQDMMSGMQYEDTEKLFEDSDAYMASGSDDSDDYVPHQKHCSHDRSLHLKVADFGLATVVDDDVMDDDAEMWRLRGRGKARFFPPEQWTAEWDAVNRNPVREHMDIAGRYSSKTNIYQVGMVMVSMMTRMLPEPYPRIFPVTIRDFDHAAHRYLDQTPEEFAQLPARVVNTPAWVMLQDQCASRYEVSLRELVIRLTAYEPAERPKPEDLVRLVEQRIDHGFAGTEYQLSSDHWQITPSYMPTEFQPVKGYTLSTGAVPAANSASTPPAPAPAAPRKKAARRLVYVPRAKRDADESSGGAPLQPSDGAMEVARIMAAMPLSSRPVPAPAPAPAPMHRPPTPMFGVPRRGNQPAHNQAYPGAPSLAHRPHPAPTYQPVYNQNTDQVAAEFARQFTQAQAHAPPPRGVIPNTFVLDPDANTFMPMYYQPGDQAPHQGNNGHQGWGYQ